MKKDSKSPYTKAQVQQMYERGRTLDFRGREDLLTLTALFMNPGSTYRELVDMGFELSEFAKWRRDVQKLKADGHLLESPSGIYRVTPPGERYVSRNLPELPTLR
jgi:hypothetical protein